jgi:hypothetical protein
LDERALLGAYSRRKAASRELLGRNLVKFRRSRGTSLSEIKIDLTEVTAIAARDGFWATRSQAIHAHVTLEQSLCLLFQSVTNIAPEMAGLVFFKITNSRARANLLDALIRKRFESKYNLFWNSFLKQLEAVDNRRNEIVHWVTATNIGTLDSAGKPIVELTLIPPTFLHSAQPTAVINTKDLCDFIKRCDVFARLCNMFCLALTGKMGDERTKAWLQIFEQPLVYPFPSDHPWHSE